MDELWEQLTADGGEEGPCGWCQDRYGLFWQIIPSSLFTYRNDPNPEKAHRAIEAMFSMTKIDIARVKEAYEAAT